MNNTTKLIGAFAIGALAGVAIAKLLETEQGKEFVEHAKDKAASAAEEIKAKIKQLENELANLTNTRDKETSGDTV
ncbi:UNVERIFIED_CONTAM: YtxH domain-containing protein [Salmonella enterica subsp. enterica serovar Weltevreden]